MRTSHVCTACTQAVLFDTKWLTDLEAARWWQSNGYRFEKAKEKAQWVSSRAASASTSRTRPALHEATSPITPLSDLS